MEIIILFIFFCFTQRSCKLFNPENTTHFCVDNPANHQKLLHPKNSGRFFVLYLSFQWFFYVPVQMPRAYRLFSIFSVRFLMLQFVFLVPTQICSPNVFIFILPNMQWRSWILVQRSCRDLNDRKLRLAVKQHKIMYKWIIAF